MFTLRVINKEGLENNQVLGESYNMINRETNAEEFRKTFKIVFGKDHVADLDKTADNYTKKCYAFVVSHEGSSVRPLYKDQSNYIMTGEGKTYDNVTYK